MSAKFNSLNLGQGFPNWSPPDFVVESALQTLQDTEHGHILHQYAPVPGIRFLTEEISKTYSPLLNKKIETSNMVVMAGATESLYATFQAFVDDGDEVITFEPFFDTYLGAVKMAGGILRPIPLRLPLDKVEDLKSSDFQFDREELRKAFNEKTKLIVLNTPHNPTGKVFTYEEIEFIASLVRSHPRCIVVSDEVYEWMTYDNTPHYRIATFEGMWERSVTISSVAKTFSVTGWKMGWAIGTPQIIAAITKAHVFAVFSIATPLQDSIARALKIASETNYYEDLRVTYQRKRDFFVKALREAGLNPIVPQGSFFVLVNIKDIKLKEGQGYQTLTNLNMEVRDWRVSRWLTTDVGVTTIPCSSFYTEENRCDDYIRFAFCKTDEVLEEASKRLKERKG